MSFLKNVSPTCTDKKVVLQPSNYSVPSNFLKRSSKKMPIVTYMACTAKKVPLVSYFVSKFRVPTTTYVITLCYAMDVITTT